MEEDPGDPAGGSPSDSPPRGNRGARDCPEEPTAMAIADQPKCKKLCKKSTDPPGCYPNSEPEDNRKYLMECSKCNIKFAPSVKFDQREVNIKLHKEKEDDQNPFFTTTLPCTKQHEEEILKPTYENCEHNLYYKYVTGNNNKGGFNIDLSITIDKDIQKEDGSKDAQPAQHEHSGDVEMQAEEEKEQYEVIEYKPHSYANSTGSESDTGNWFSRLLFSRTPTRDTVKVKVHFISNQDTFGAADAIKKQLKSNMGSSLQEEERRKECNMIVVFCPIFRSVESDVNSMMEATAVSSPGKPVILVVMHHTRDPDYSTGPYDPRETWKNVVHYVHALYHETTPGLLKCFHNDQAIKGIQQFLLKKQQFV
ncbi:uncharacterized protein LOC105922959 [Fundulus heteroclitus]|uniref:uncharacterized protein LOC105922959 n=1 Tax=Fundulus heteroclitus TaxID=8078 RepID=UPI00165B743A|nr:uncharacterized protein LOC105922959 [Fundulus heteroclitus]